MSTYRRCRELERDRFLSPLSPCSLSPEFKRPFMKTKLIVAAVLITATCCAQVSLKSEPGEMPQIKNAKLETVAASGSLQQQIEAFSARQSGTAWIGYAVPA